MDLILPVLRFLRSGVASPASPAGERHDRGAGRGTADVDEGPRHPLRAVAATHWSFQARRERERSVEGLPRLSMREKNGA